ncbi:MAG: hypothetical protein AMXMBFR61_17960 [Fimbriimonadales bacterium]
MSESIVAPFVSVVLPARNEERFIEPCLRSLLSSDYPSERMEIIVVDGASEDRTAEIVSDLAAEDGRIRLLENPNRTVPYAMNLGIRAARGDIIVRVDAHATYPPDYVARSVQTLQKTGAWNVGGVWVTQPGGPSAWARAISLALTHGFGVGGSAYRTGSKSGWVDTVPFGAFRREAFERAGLYRECLTRHQDYELNARIRSSGGGIYLDPEIRCEYFARPSLSALARQKYADGKWCVYSWLVCPEAYAFRHAAPGIVVAVVALLAAGSALSPVPLGALAMLAALYSLGSANAAVELLATSRRWEALLTPLVFPILHFGHGIGVIAGLLSSRRWGAVGAASRPAPRLAARAAAIEEVAA